MNRLTWFLVVSGAAVLAYSWTPDTWLQTASYNAIGFLGVVAIAIGVRAHRPTYPAPWWLLAFGQLCYIGGDLTAAVMRRGWGIEPFPSVADYVYLPGYALQALALLLLIRRPSRHHDRAALLEAAIIAAAFGLMAWVFFMKPVTTDPDLTVGAKLISVGYPALDLLLLTLLARLLTGAASRNAAFLWLVSSITLTLVGDYAWAFTDRLEYDGGTVLSHALDAIFLASYLASGAAALHPSMRQLGQHNDDFPRERLGPLKLTLLTGATLIAPALLAWQAARHAGVVADAAAIVIGSVGMFLLVIARMVLLLQQVQSQSAQLEHQALALQKLAEHDPLTGLPNRRAWNVALPVALENARRDRKPISIAMIDLDYFKRYNDTFGHQAGDRLLKSAAAAWAARLRRVDLLARYGGEEFIVLLPATAPTQAAALLDELRLATPQDQTFSAGVAGWDGDEPHEALVERADRALYAAKAAGRNQVMCAPPPIVPPDHQGHIELSVMSDGGPPGHID